MSEAPARLSKGCAIHDVWHNGGVDRTTVYLTPELRRGLKNLSRRTGKSQSDLIREAVGELIAKEPKAALPRFVGVLSDAKWDSVTWKREGRKAYIEHLNRKHGFSR